MILEDIKENDPLVLALTVGEEGNPGHDISSDELSFPIGTIEYVFVLGSADWVHSITTCGHIKIELRLFTPIWHIIREG
jgi:hypothetical protein